MLTGLRLNLLRFSSFPRMHISAGRFVALTFMFSAIVLFLYVAKNVSRVPVHDEYANVSYLFCHPPLTSYWDQHNEHRIPLPRVLYVAAVRLAGNDFRAPSILNVFLLLGASAFMLLCIRRERGKTTYTDAIIPLGMLTIGQYDNLLWGFQVQFVTSTVLVIVALGLAVQAGLIASKRRLAVLATCGLLLPLCGANGVAFAPGIGMILLFASVWNLWGRDRNWSTGLFAAAAGLAVFILIFTYFHGLQVPPHHQTAHGTSLQTVVGTVNMLGTSFGPVVRLLPPQPYDGVTLLGVVGLVLVAGTGLLLVRSTLDPAKRGQAVALGGVLVGFLGLAVGIAKARAGLTNLVIVNRYVTLMLPVVIGAYAAWTALGGSTRVPRILFGLVALAVIPNAFLGLDGARLSTYLPREVEYQIKSGMPLEFIADRNRGIFPGEPKFRRVAFDLLRTHGVSPFRDAAKCPPLHEEPIPIRVLRMEDLLRDGDAFVVAGQEGDIGHVVFQLPRRQHLYGLKLTYEAESGTVQGLPNVVSWEADGQRPTSSLSGVVNQLEPLDRPTETVIYVDREAEAVRIDLFGQGARMKVHSIVILTRAE